MKCVFFFLRYNIMSLKASLKELVLLPRMVPISWWPCLFQVLGLQVCTTFRLEMYVFVQIFLWPRSTIVFFLLLSWRNNICFQSWVGEHWLSWSYWETVSLVCKQQLPEEFSRTHSTVLLFWNHFRLIEVAKMAK